MSTTLESFFLGTKGGTKTDRKARRKKQLSAPPQSTFWQPGDDVGNTNVINNLQVKEDQSTHEPVHKKLEFELPNEVQEDQRKKGRTRRKKQVSAPVSSNFWKPPKESGDEKGNTTTTAATVLHDSVGGEDNSSLERQRSTNSNQSAPPSDLNDR